MATEDGIDLSTLGPCFELFSLADVPEPVHQADRGPGHLAGSLLAARALGSAGHCPVPSGPPGMALHLHGGGGSPEGAAPRQGGPGAGLALLQPVFWGTEARYPHEAQEALLAWVPNDDSG